MTVASKNNLIKNLLNIAGAALYSLGINLFIAPLNLYSGGAMGVTQLINTLLVVNRGVQVPSWLDLTGIIYYILNIPLLILAYRKLGRTFFIRTMLSVVTITLVMALVSVPESLVSNTLTACMVGGLLAGYGVGLMLRNGGSGGGLDIIGMYMTQKVNGASVGKVSLAINVILYTICALLFSVEIAIYSVIFTVVMSLITDRTHYQNQMIEAKIFTKVDGVAKPIMDQLGRGATEWVAAGSYTQEGTHVIVTLISKYEVAQVRKMVRDMDPKAFVIYTQVAAVDGNFLKKL